MRPRLFLCITILVLYHSVVMGQALTNALPPAQSGTAKQNAAPQQSEAALLPNDPGQEAMPVAEPEAAPVNGVPVSWKADRQTWASHVATLYGVDDFLYRDYVIRADKIVYHQDTTELEAEGHLHVTGGPEDIDVTASHGEMRLNTHVARFYDVTGSIGIRRVGQTAVFSTANPFLIRARVLLETSRGSYRVIDGSMTNCRLPKPDWELLSRMIKVEDGVASTKSTYFKLFGIPLFYLPYLRHPVDVNGRESGFLIPEFSNSSIRGFTLREQYYWAINRSMDMEVGAEYYSKRGWAPKGDFRYKGPGLDHMMASWDALIDRGYNQLQTSGPQTGQTVRINQGGADILAGARKDFSPATRVAGNAEYLSSYEYRLVFNDNYWQAINSQVRSDVAWTKAKSGYVPSVEVARLQTFASSTEGDEVRLLHLPAVRFDALDRPLGDEAAAPYWGLGSSISHLGRAEPNFHARNVGRIDFYPHLSWPLVAGGWSIVPQAALRGTWYTTSQVPDLRGSNGGIPTVSHDPLHRLYGEAGVDVRPPALERDFTIGRGDTVLRHVIEPELFYHFAGGVGEVERDVLLVDTTDIATDANELGFSLTQRFYVKAKNPAPCADVENADANTCRGRVRQWASWQIAQKYFLDPNFGGALIPNRRNVFTSTLDLTGVAFLTGPRNLGPLVSRMRFEAVPNLRIEWDMDYDTKPGRFGADNIYAGYSWGSTTVGIGHALLNAVNETGSSATRIQSQQLSPFVEFGRPNRVGFNMAANGGYDFVHGSLEYGGVQAVYNWDCCGLMVGYRRFALGSLRDETQYLYSFTLANFGSVGDIRRSNSVFRDRAAPPAY